MSKKVRIRDPERRIQNNGLNFVLMKSVNILLFTRSSIDYRAGVCARAHARARHAVSTCVRHLVYSFSLLPELFSSQKNLSVPDNRTKGKTKVTQ